MSTSLDWGLPRVDCLSHQTGGSVRTRQRQLLPSSAPGLGAMGEAGRYCPCHPPQALPERATHLVGEEPVPLVLLGGRAVHPLEDRVPDEDRQRSQDEGREQVQVDVVSGAVQVSAGESKGSSWQDGQRVCSPSFSSPANEPLRQVSASGTMLLSFFLCKCPSSS